MDALIGFNGFVGSTLLSQLPNEPEKYNSSNLEDIEFKTFDNLYICCPTGSKYYVNEHSYQDYMNMRDILRLLATVNCNDCYLVSSQDCNSTLYSDETFTCYPFTEYGKNRLFFEDAIRDLFENHHVMRIGCLFGKGLKRISFLIFLIITIWRISNQILHTSCTIWIICTKICEL